MWSAERDGIVSHMWAHGASRDLIKEHLDGTPGIPVPLDAITRRAYRLGVKRTAEFISALKRRVAAERELLRPERGHLWKPTRPEKKAAPIEPPKAQGFSMLSRLAPIVQKPAEVKQKKPRKVPVYTPEQIEAARENVRWARQVYSDRVKERNGKIVEDLRAGLGVEDIAEKYGVTVYRARRIRTLNFPCWWKGRPRTEQRTKWTPSRDRSLRELWHEGASTKRIAIHLGVTRNAIQSRARLIGLPSRPLFPPFARKAA